MHAATSFRQLVNLNAPLGGRFERSGHYLFQLDIVHDFVAAVARHGG